MTLGSFLKNGCVVIPEPAVLETPDDTLRIPRFCADRRFAIVSRKRLAFIRALGCLLLLGCDSDSDALHPSEFGTLELPLTTTLDGEVYTLFATFAIDGPEFVELSADATTGSVLRQTLEPGTYQVTVDSDFVLQRDGEDVEAELLSDESQWVEIRALATERVEYRFGVEGTSIVDFGSGELELGFAVQSSARIDLPGHIRTLVRAPGGVLYGLDYSEPRIWEIDIRTGSATSWSSGDLPEAGCVTPDGTRLFTLEGLNPTIVEYALPDRTLVREIPWDAPRHDRGEHYHIHCGSEQLYLVDQAWAPGLWTLENLATDEPLLTDRTAIASGVGDLVLSEDESTLYYWFQYGWGAGNSISDLIQVNLDDWSTVDAFDQAVPSRFYRDPRDTPILWDTTRGLLFAKNRVVRDSDVGDTVHLLLSDEDGSSSAHENVFAIDPLGGYFATRNSIYSTETGDLVAPTAVQNAQQYWFSPEGVLYAFRNGSSELISQRFRP